MSKFTTDTYSYFTDKKGNFFTPTWINVPQNGPNSDGYRACLNSLPVRGSEESLRYTWMPQRPSILSLSTGKSYLMVDKIYVTDKDFDAFIRDENIAEIQKYFAKDNQIKKLLKLLKSLKNGTMERHTFDPLTEFLGADSVVLFGKSDSNEGFVSKNGQLGNLSKALLFASERDAQSAINRLSAFTHQQYQVVRVNMQMTGLGSVLSPTTYKSNYTQEGTLLAGSSIDHMAAEVQKRNIEQALKQASFEEFEAEYNRRIEERKSVKRKM